MVRIEGVTKSDGTLFAKEVEGAEQPGEAELEGLVTRVSGNPAFSLDIVGQDGAGNGMDDTKIGARFTVDVSGVGNSKYRIAKGKLDFRRPTGSESHFPFDGSTIHPGQRVEVESMTSLPPAQGNVAAEKVTLQQQAVSGTVSNFTSVAGTGQFDLNLPSDGSSYITVLSGQTVVHVFLQSGTDNRVAGIANGANVRVRGVLFWTGSTFNMIARRITP